MKRAVVGITGASGSIYGIKLIKALKAHGVEVHLIISEYGKVNIELESTLSWSDLISQVDAYYDNDDLGAVMASGSQVFDVMFIVPCSMKTLSGLAYGFTDSLISRTGDVFLKEKRPLIVSPRETPLNEIHLRNMLKLAEMGVRIVPPMPAFYNNPETIDDIVSHLVMRLLDQVGIHDKGKRYLD
ncbi:UbiX family flavin prenyltransferase [Enterococcus gilvus]|uniref:UbiX family flavin prenyltransferase n=1 Tax=Enterococcus gilvus TaxID=160453 RepID=UPI0028D599D0|nr:UbiX family flavin prenyltransferase [Enterococcus gilvus]